MIFRICETENMAELVVGLAIGNSADGETNGSDSTPSRTHGGNSHVPGANEGSSTVPGANEGNSHVPGANEGSSTVPETRSGGSADPGTNGGDSSAPETHTGGSTSLGASCSDVLEASNDGSSVPFEPRVILDNLSNQPGGLPEHQSREMTELKPLKHFFTEQQLEDALLPFVENKPHHDMYTNLGDLFKIVSIDAKARDTGNVDDKVTSGPSFGRLTCEKA